MYQSPIHIKPMTMMFSISVLWLKRNVPQLNMLDEFNIPQSANIPQFDGYNFFPD